MDITEEQKRFLPFIELNIDEAAQARNSLLLNAHFVEKEMVVNQSDFPSDKFMENVSKSSAILLDKYPNYDEFALLTGCRLLTKYDTQFQFPTTCRFSSEQKAKSESIEVGRKLKTPKLKKSPKGIKLIEERASYRLFEEKVLPEKEILDIIKTAMTAPSACNRQPCKIVYALTPEENNVLRNIVPDMFVRTKIYNFFAIICDKSFFNKGEEMQCYVNGGILLQNLLLSIHAHGYGATAFQTPIFAGVNEKNKEALNLKPSEFILATVGYGIPKKGTLVAAAQKRPLKYTSKKVEI